MMKFIREFLATLSILLCINNGAGEEPIVNFRDMKVRLANTHGGTVYNGVVREGRVEISLDKGTTYGSLCASRFGIPEGNVICQELGLGYAAKAYLSTHYGTRSEYPWAMVGTVCRGNEDKLSECHREETYPSVCNEANQNIAVVSCEERATDLELGVEDIERTARLDIVPISIVRCAIEEKCLSQAAVSAYSQDRRARVRLIRFDTKASNVGTKDFRPAQRPEEWQWHQCHRHFHSMEAFAAYYMFNMDYDSVAEGHKASFCLMDSECDTGIQKYTCGNYTQGISMGCADVYQAGLDCQWIDVTNLEINKSYILVVEINPNTIIPEMSYENNAVACTVYLTDHPSTTKVSDCHRVPLVTRSRKLD